MGGLDLFDGAGDTQGEPLAYRMRPRNLDEYIGQDHIVGPGRLLRRVIQADQLSSLIFYGPPGTGKTTLARVIANHTKSAFLSLNAVLAGVKQLRESLQEAQENRRLYGRRTILFIDEVHRWNKAQQDALLPWVENGTVVLIGATTQNPYFEVNSALVSRSRIFQLKPLTDTDLRAIAEATVGDRERGYGKYTVEIDEDALTHLIDVSSGDARSLLNALELAVETTPSEFPPPPDETIRITLPVAEESIQRRAVLYDKEGDYHFDVISAFIKSLRGSDPDAALYWLAKMVSAGEDPRYIFRRMLISACEDVGLADPQALVIVEAAAAAFDRVGLPEGQFHLIHACLYLATTPKSNSALGYFDAVKTVESERNDEVPNHLRDGNRDKEGFGHGEGYIYPHAFRDHWVAQQYLPDGLQGRVFYEPSQSGYEGEVRREVQRRREAQLEISADPPPEVLTFGYADRSREHWITRAAGEAGRVLGAIRERLFDELKLRRHDRVLVACAGRGMLVWEAFRRVPEGGVWVTTEDEGNAAVLTHRASQLPETERPTILTLRLENLDESACDGLLPGLRFDAVVSRNPVTRLAERAGFFEAAYTVSAPGARLAVAQVVPAEAQRLSALLPTDLLAEELADLYRNAETCVYSRPDDPLVAWTADSLAEEAGRAGYTEVSVSVHRFDEERVIRNNDLDSWFSGTYGRILRESLSDDDYGTIETAVRGHLSGATVRWSRTVAFLTGRKP